MLTLDKIWVEKYRPKTLTDIILDEETLRTVNEFQKAKEIPNLLLCGIQGTGKTSLAQILVKNVLRCNYMYLNASDESGIDTIRTKVSNFAQTKSFDGKVKVVILDEADGLTGNAQQMLRNTMESFAATCRFILTANYKHKIIPAIQSRCQLLTPTPDYKAAVGRIVKILSEEGVAVSKEQRGKLVDLIKLYFPDLRKTINEIQKNVVDDKLCINKIKIDDALYAHILTELSKKRSIELRKYLIENDMVFNGDYDELLRQFLNHLYTTNLEDTKKKQMIAIIAEHLYRSVFVLDKEINASACWIMLEDVFI